MRPGMSSAGMRILAWVWGHLLTLSMPMPSLLCTHALSQAERLRKVLTDTPSFVFTHHKEHSLAKMALNMIYEFFVSLDLSQREDSSGRLAASWQGRSICLKGEDLTGCTAGICCVSKLGTAPHRQ